MNRIAEGKRTIKVEFENDDGDWFEVQLPAKYEVCDRCQGVGSHVNPSIDGNGITASEWAEWDIEDREHYMSGIYDVACHDCHGARVVLCVDEERIETHGTELEKKGLKAYNGESEHNYEDELYARMERGYYE